MLIVSDPSFNISIIVNEYPETSIEGQLLSKMSTNTEEYQYDNLNQLIFELNFRKEIVNSAIQLNKSDLAFAVFKDSKCNLNYWSRTNNGGFLINNGVNPNEAISDIFTNGGEYATECSTAIMIIYYKGLLNIYGDDLFNKLFPKIYLMDWDIREPLFEKIDLLKAVSDILFGDRAYFNNPDFNPATPEWQGENVIVLPDSLYYGHGIGVTTADVIIQDLNSKRKENITQSAYLIYSVGRPNFKKLSDVYYDTSSHATPIVWKSFPDSISFV